ncbi:MAG: hypothetical protein ACRD1L_11530 [Terriglobales bacterium]
MNVAALTGPADAARRGRDFLAVLDVSPKSPTYGRLAAMVPVSAVAAMPHHTNYALPADDRLFANDFTAGRTFIFNLADSVHPRLAAEFGAAGNYTHPHSYVRLANGHTLATFQQSGNHNTAPGGLVELDAQGHTVRSSAAAAPQVESFIRPYSLEVVPALDRVVTTSADMYSQGSSHVIQVWRLSDLQLLKTVQLPHRHAQPQAAIDSSEPRLLADGRTVLVGTFKCGLYRVDGLAGTEPSASLVYDFGGRKCSVPVVSGHYWIEAMESSHSIVSLDISDPSHPVEVGRLRLGPNDLPHWLALEPGGDRIVITGYGSLFFRLLIAKFDARSGQLSLDRRFREAGAARPGFSFDRHWPDGWQGPAIPHGAVFSPRARP